MRKEPQRGEKRRVKEQNEKMKRSNRKRLQKKNRDEHGRAKLVVSFWLMISH